jgi:hypothetical protein
MLITLDYQQRIIYSGLETTTDNSFELLTFSVIVFHCGMRLMD